MLVPEKVWLETHPSIERLEASLRGEVPGHDTHWLGELRTSSLGSDRELLALGVGDHW